MHYGLFSGARYHHTRGDRDHHIKIHPKNVKTEHGVKFEIFDPLPETPYSVNYATDSITHYEKDAYCRNCDNDTITEIKASIGYGCEVLKVINHSDFFRLFVGNQTINGTAHKLAPPLAMRSSF